MYMYKKIFTILIYLPLFEFIYSLILYFRMSAVF